jgi:hypothetical protein
LQQETSYSGYSNLLTQKAQQPQLLQILGNNGLEVNAQQEEAQMHQ